MWPEATQKAFVDYVNNGGGLVVYHFACAAFPQWKEYNEMIGLGGWGGRNEKDGPYMRWKDGQIVRDASPGKGGGHGPTQPFQMVVREANHPITQGLPEKFMHVSDELYGWLRGPGNNLTVLATAFAPKELGGAGEHEPLLFTVGYGKAAWFKWRWATPPKNSKASRSSHCSSGPRNGPPPARSRCRCRPTSRRRIKPACASSSAPRC